MTHQPLAWVGEGDRRAGSQTTNMRDSRSGRCRISMDRRFISSYIFVVFVIITSMGTLPDLAHTAQASSPPSDGGAVTVTEGSSYVLLSNGIVTVEFSRRGLLNEVSYGKHGNLLQGTSLRASQALRSDIKDTEGSDPDHYVQTAWQPSVMAEMGNGSNFARLRSADANGDSDGNSTWSIFDFPENLDSENFRTTSAPLVQRDNASAGSAAAAGNRNPGGYHDMVWASCDGRECPVYERFSADEYRRITPESVTDRVEISFVQFPNKGQRGAPMKIDMRYVMQRGEPGFYSYLILDHGANDSTIRIGELRLVLRLSLDKFDYAALADQRRRHMPGEIDLSPARSSPLAFKEARNLTNPVNPEFKHEVDHKYHYTADIKDMKVHGWVGPASNPAVGIWMISPSRMEYMGGGPEKQDLTVQVGPIILNMLHSGHYGTPAVSVLPGQVWRKTYGPYFFYVNGEAVCSSSSGEEVYGCLWNDAVSRAAKEESLWPYDWAVSSDYPSKGSRSSVSGTIDVEDPEWDKTTFGRGTDDSWVGLAAEGLAGTWAVSSSGYQFWSKIQSNGDFHIPNVRPGSYSLFAYVHGVIGDFVLQEKVVVGSGGGSIDVGRKVIRPPRNGPTIWSIGIADRSFGEFFVPVLNPLSPLPYPSTGPNRWRNYGAWLRYAEVYPDGDPVFHIDHSDYTRDWYFVHCPRRVTNTTTGADGYSSTVRRINFTLPEVKVNSSYTLRIGEAGSSYGATGIAVNERSNQPFIFRTERSGRDNAVARASDHGRYRQYEVVIPSSKLVQGPNTISLTLDNVQGPFNYVGYDCIRFEGPS